MFEAYVELSNPFYPDALHQDFLYSYSANIRQSVLSKAVKIVKLFIRYIHNTLLIVTTKL